MLKVTVVFIVSFTVLAMAATHIIDVVDGNQTDIGLPAGFTGLTLLLGVVIAAIAAGVLIAPLVPVIRARSMGAKSRRSRRVRS